MKNITLISLGQTGAGPVYSLEMAKALASSEGCNLQIIVSNSVTNLDAWKDAFSHNKPCVRLCVVKAYKHTKLSVLLNFFNYHRKLKIVKLIKEFNTDVLYVPFGLIWSRFIYALLPKRIKIITTIHDVQPHDRFNTAEVFSKILSCGSGRFVDGYVILNNKDKPIVEERYNKPVEVIPHASFGYYFTNDTKIQSIRKTIGFFGRIEPYKGLDLLVDAFELTKTSGLKLLIAGSGAIGEELEERIKKNSRITLVNRYIKDEEFQPLLDKIDFVVLPYKRASQSGVIPMCFAYGKTVIATNVGALSEQVPEGTGFLTEPDAKSIAKQIDGLYENEELIYNYGCAAQKYAEEELSWNKSAMLLLQFVDSFH